MAQTYKDPVEYLNDLVVKRGKSGRNTVYATNVTVVMDSTQQLPYRNSVTRFNLLDPPISPPANLEPLLEWYELLLRMRVCRDENSETVIFAGKTYQFLPEGGKLSMNVFLPKVYVDHFQYEAQFSQEILQEVASFLGYMPTVIRFNIGIAEKTWEKLVEEGEVEEVDLTY